MPPGPGLRAVLASTIAGALVGTSIVGLGAHDSRAQPAAPDVDRAKLLFTAAKQALAEGRHADAIRDFGAAFEITKDPVVFYWIATANDKAGACDVALIYYGRYLREAHPAPRFVELTDQRIAACGGAPPDLGSSAGSGSDAIPAGSDTGSGSAAIPATGARPPPEAGSGSATPAKPLRARHQGPWLMIGGSLALITVGAVLAYSANASENDLDDLYVGLEGTPPVFDARTQQRYEDLLAEGRRYERLSWVSFALAGGLGIGAAVWFYVDRDRTVERELEVTPTVQPGGVGAAATIRW